MNDVYDKVSKSILEMVPTIAIFLVGTFFSGLINAQALESFKVGNETIRIAPPNGYVNAVNTSSKLKEIGEALTFKNNRLLALYVPRETISQAIDSLDIGDRYAMLQVAKREESNLFTEEKFTRLKLTVKDQLISSGAIDTSKYTDDIAAKGKKLSVIYGEPDSQLTMGASKFIEVFKDDINKLSVVMQLKSKGNFKGELKELVQVAVMTITTVNGKLIFFYTYATHNSVNDVKWVKKQTEDFLLKNQN